MEGALTLSPASGHALGTIPPPPPPRSVSIPRLAGVGVLGAALAALGALAAYRIMAGAAKPRPGDARTHLPAARRLNGAAAILSWSVLADSGLEHYRGTFHNPAMYVAPTVAAVSLAGNLHSAATPQHLDPARAAISGVALATGIAGTGFHLYNLAKREGGIDLLNLFYGAPLGAPMAIALAGLSGLSAARLVSENETKAPATLLGLRAGPLLALGTSGALVGTAAEAALLHFRGAFHDPFMYLPVTVPPLTAVVLALALRHPRWRRPARAMLRATATIGLAGLGFHALGIARNMGGFYNWSQNVLQGPPLPAPPSFTGVALAGLAALSLMERP